MTKTWRPLSFKAGVQRHREITVRPVSTRDWLQRFQPDPPTSLEALLIKLGPFDPDRDAFAFNNLGFTFTDQQVNQIREHYHRLVISAVSGPLQSVRDVLNSLSVDIAGITFGLPDVVTDAVDSAVRTELTGLLTAKIVNLIGPPKSLRCGGMAFAGYDFYLLGWTVDGLDGGTTTSPSTGVLGNYIFSRLLDSLDLNGGTFLEWFANLHLMPEVSTVANTALGSAVGSLGGALGAAFGALIGSHIDVFDLGGPKSLLKASKHEWSRIKSTLDVQAACPVGCVFPDSTTPFDDHQILAVGYDDGTATLTVWDNNDGPFARDLKLDFTGDELGVGNFRNDRICKGLFLEAYSPRQPPDSLRL